MERIVLSATLHCAHRLPGTQSQCRFVHGITWRVTLAVTTRAFGRDVHDRSELRAGLRRLLDQCDHALIVTANDPMACPSPGNDARVVVVSGRAPTIENLARHLLNESTAVIRTLPGSLVPECNVEVAITEGSVTFMVGRAEPGGEQAGRVQPR